MRTLRLTTTAAAVDTYAGQVTGFTARLLTYGEESSPDWFGDTAMFLPGSLYLPDDAGVPLLREHDDGTVAAGELLDIYEADGQVFASFGLLDTAAGDEAATELAANLRTDVSIGVDLLDYTSVPIDDDAWTYRTEITRAELVETSQCLRGRLPSAGITEITAAGR